MLLAHKAASEELTQAEAQRDQAEIEKERQTTNLCELNRRAAEHMEMFQEDQEMLRNIEIDEQRVRSVRLQAEAGQREGQECEKVLKQIEEQKKALWEWMKKRQDEMDEAQNQWIRVSEEESRVDISTDTGDMDYSVIAEQGQLPKALTDVEEQAYSRLVLVETNQIQWKYEALSYLTSIIKGNQEAWEQGTEM